MGFIRRGLIAIRDSWVGRISAVVSVVIAISLVDHGARPSLSDGVLALVFGAALLLGGWWTDRLFNLARVEDWRSGRAIEKSQSYRLESLRSGVCVAAGLAFLAAGVIALAVS